MRFDLILILVFLLATTSCSMTGNVVASDRDHCNNFAKGSPDQAQCYIDFASVRIDESYCDNIEEEVTKGGAGAYVYTKELCLNYVILSKALDTHDLSMCETIDTSIIITQGSNQERVKNVFSDTLYDECVEKLS